MRSEMIRLQHAPIDVDEVIQNVLAPASGAVDVFIGTTRDHAAGRSVRALDYEAHETMALREIEKIVAAAKERWKVAGIAVIHRLGRVNVGEASVVIAVSAAHRAEAFDACRHVIDTLKQTVPIWKREEFTDGTSEWSGQPSPGLPTSVHP
jgi:molybdopterin synthase catalytic subunit